MHVIKITPDEAHQLARDLVTEVMEHAGDDAAVCSTLLEWDDRIGADLPVVSMAAMRLIFGTCLVPHPDAVPFDALTLDVELGRREVNQ